MSRRAALAGVDACFMGSAISRRELVRSSRSHDIAEQIGVFQPPVRDISSSCATFK
jgi:hypothetical protein